MLLGAGLSCGLGARCVANAALALAAVGCGVFSASSPLLNEEGRCRDAAPTTTVATDAWRMVQNAPVGRVKRLSVSSAGLLATLSYDDTLRIWDIEHAALLSKISLGAVPTEVAWDSDTLVLALPVEQRRYDLRGQLLEQKEVVAGSFLRSARGYLPQQLERDYQKSKYLFPRDSQTKVELANVWLGLSDVDIDDARRVLLAQHSQSGTLLLWRVDDSGKAREERFRPSSEAAPYGDKPFALSPDGQRLASAFSLARGGRLELHTTQPPTETLSSRDFKAAPSDVVYAPDGKTITVAGFGGVYQFEAATLEPLWRHEPLTVDADTGSARVGANYDRLAYTHDSRRVVATRSSGVMDVLDASSGRLQQTLGSEVREPRVLSFVDDDTLAVLSKDHVAIWSLGEARPLAQLNVGGVEAVLDSAGNLVTLRQVGCFDHQRLYFDVWKGFEPTEGLRMKFYERERSCRSTQESGAGGSVTLGNRSYPEWLKIPSPDLLGGLEVDPATGWALLSAAGVAPRSGHQVVDLHSLLVSTLRTEGEPIFVGEYRLGGGWVTAVLTRTVEEGMGVGVWDPRTGKLRTHLLHRNQRGVGSMHAYSVAPDGKSIGCGSLATA